MKVGTYQIPFTRDGHQLTYVSPWQLTNGAAKMKDNHEFSDMLELVDMQRGRSAAHFTMRRRNTGTLVVVFMKDFMDMFRHASKGVVEGRFTFIKRGQNYGCCRIGD